MSDEGIGSRLREARLAKGFSLEAMARELHWKIELLQAVEHEAWDQIPPGQERPMVRQMAARLEVSLDDVPEAWAGVPGEVEQEPPDPHQVKLDRAMSIVLALGSLGVVAWLVIPGRDLRSGAKQPVRARAAGAITVLPQTTPGQPYPVVGEAIPEAPVTEEGVLISLRAIDQALARIEAGAQRLEQPLRVSEPWRVRVRGPFTLNLDNAGVVMVEVAGRPVPHGRHIGETWSGTFDATGQWILPPAPPADPADVPPETTPD